MNDDGWVMKAVVGIAAFINALDTLCDYSTVYLVCVLFLCEETPTLISNAVRSNQLGERTISGNSELADRGSLHRGRMCRSPCPGIHAISILANVSRLRCPGRA